MKISSTAWIGLLGILLFGFIVTNKSPEGNPYDKIIRGDGKAYYAYLPAVFIYQDLSYSFIDDIEQKYYNNDPTLAKDFLNTTENGEKVNKTYPGVAILYLPFFLIAHFLSYIFDYPTDGYSIIYQWSIAFSHIFYFCLALYLLLKIWQKNKWPINRFWGLALTTVFATQLGYYLILDHSLTHLFGWFLFVLIIYILSILYEKQKRSLFFILGLIVTLTLIVRPTNLLFLLFTPFLFPLFGWKISEWKKLFTLKTLGITCFGGVIPLLIVVLLWYWQTGQFYVYSYGNESFNFLNPHLINFTFGFEKGWLLYTPFAGLAITIIAYKYFKTNWKLGAYWLFVWFFIVFIFSSWWSWNYGLGFSQRVMIEFSIFFLLPLFTLPKITYIKYSIPFFALLNVWQSYQVSNGILPGGHTTKTIYFNHFFDTSPNAFYFLEDNQKVVYSKVYVEEQVKIKENDFSYNWNFTSPDINAIGIRFRMDIKVNHIDPTYRIVLASETGFYQAFFMSQFLEKGNYVTIELGTKAESILPHKNWVIYIWDPERKSAIWVKNVTIEFFSSS